MSLKSNPIELTCDYTLFNSVHLLRTDVPMRLLARFSSIKSSQERSIQEVIVANIDSDVSALNNVYMYVQHSTTQTNQTVRT
jgi:hypothetical protein